MAKQTLAQKRALQKYLAKPEVKRKQYENWKRWVRENRERWNEIQKTYQRKRRAKKIAEVETVAGVENKKTT